MDALQTQCRGQSHVRIIAFQSFSDQYSILRISKSRERRNRCRLDQRVFHVFDIKTIELDVRIDAAERRCSKQNNSSAHIFRVGRVDRPLCGFLGRWGREDIAHRSKVRTDGVASAQSCTRKNHRRNNRTSPNHSSTNRIASLLHAQTESVVSALHHRMSQLPGVGLPQSKLTGTRQMNVKSSLPSLTN